MGGGWSGRVCLRRSWLVKNTVKILICPEERAQEGSVIGWILKDIICQAREFTLYLVINREPRSDLNPGTDTITPGLWKTSCIWTGSGAGRRKTSMGHQPES